jgi:hypothetical protein
LLFLKLLLLPLLPGAVKYGPFHIPQDGTLLLCQACHEAVVAVFWAMEVLRYAPADAGDTIL